ncbi:uncharacterized protein CTHT_0003420 [Thermochaetoides thermophila DSM 1495]|uniref:Uncharacterized protein n=1 Tax=Chaetomium thermophilum (strain DSM 1495 / CBS 144.50 / IMI 039719) TaxID=759272 RepID=G0RZL8_CHATD|nr:hypothetical protein CTHT_0003420 [Thermochaetoides thermophila DSM 1495]EGS23646.1 hypothetical protein CTHT_0003420 [Thermochaetoides thermophila DSM 1495]
MAPTPPASAQLLSATGLPRKKSGPQPKPLKEIKRVERTYTRERKIEVLMYLLNHRVPDKRDLKHVPRARLGQPHGFDRNKDLVQTEDGEWVWYRPPTYAEASAFWKIPMPTICGWWESRKKLLEGTGIELPKCPDPLPVPPRSSPRPRPPLPAPATPSTIASVHVVGHVGVGSRIWVRAGQQPRPDRTICSHARAKTPRSLGFGSDAKPKGPRDPSGTIRDPASGPTRSQVQQQRAQPGIQPAPSVTEQQPGPGLRPSPADPSPTSARSTSAPVGPCPTPALVPQSAQQRQHQQQRTTRPSKQGAAGSAGSTRPPAASASPAPRPSQQPAAYVPPQHLPPPHIPPESNTANYVVVYTGPPPGPLPGHYPLPPGAVLPVVYAGQPLNVPPLSYLSVYPSPPPVPTGVPPPLPCPCAQPQALYGVPDPPYAPAQQPTHFHFHQHPHGAAPPSPHAPGSIMGQQQHPNPLNSGPHPPQQQASVSAIGHPPHYAPPAADPAAYAGPAGHAPPPPHQGHLARSTPNPASQPPHQHANYQVHPAYHLPAAGAHPAGPDQGPTPPVATTQPGPSPHPHSAAPGMQPSMPHPHPAGPYAQALSPQPSTALATPWPADFYPPPRSATPSGQTGHLQAPQGCAAPLVVVNETRQVHQEQQHLQQRLQQQQPPQQQQQVSPLAHLPQQQEKHAQSQTHISATTFPAPGPSAPNQTQQEQIATTTAPSVSGAVAQPATIVDASNNAQLQLQADTTVALPSSMSSSSPSEASPVTTAAAAAVQTPTEKFGGGVQQANVTENEDEMHTAAEDVFGSEPGSPADSVE